nr:putative UPF0481 protein At3g02645 [Tanacetum cinerariifolium]
MSNSKNKQPQDHTDYDGIDPMGFLLGCAKKGDRKKQSRPTICKVSRVLRDHSEDSFNPQLVSIGPIHREDEKLKEFEWLKESYLHDLLNRCDSTPEETLEACLAMVKTLMDQIRESYGGMIEKYIDDEVATMMVMDGCFIIEFFFKHENVDLHLPNKMQNLRIAMDLILLENQVPFVVLQALFDCTMGEVFPITLNYILDLFLESYINIFGSCSLSPETTIHFDSDATHDHVLGYLHKRYQHVVSKPSNPIHAPKSKLVAAIHALKSKLVAAKSLNPIRALISKLVDKKGSKNTHAEESKLVDEKGLENTFHSIVELDRYGMNFNPYQEGGWSMTIKFQSSLYACLPGFKPTLLMPTLVIQDFTQLILRNFIAYEQWFPKDHYYFTSYAYAMDMLIDTQEDIAKLVKSKVLVNMLGSNQEAADMINKICKNIYITKFYYTQEFNEIDKYYNSFWPKSIARLRRIYYENPWKAIALLAAIILNALTVVQTVYTIMGK